MSESTLANPDAPLTPENELRFPTETEIYIRPDGCVIIADLPVELAPLASALGVTEPCEIGTE